jgi:hypothetical protein
MPSFPALRSGAVTMYGLQRETRFGTGVVQFCDDSEQRWKAHGALAAFTLEFRNIGGYDLANILEFFRSMKGAFDSTWDLTIDATTNSNLCFDQDEITWTETKPDRFSLSLRVRQVRAA